MSEFRKKPVVIDAIKLDGQTVAVAMWLTANGCEFRSLTHPTDATQDALVLPTLEGDMRADPGDWIIKGVHGEFYPCKPDIFAATYEPADGSAESVCVRLDGLADKIAETFGFRPCGEFARCSGGDNPTVPSYCSDDQCQNSEHRTRVPCTNRWHKIAGFVQSLAVQ